MTQRYTMKIKVISTFLLLTTSILAFGQFEKYSSYEQLDSLSMAYSQINKIDSAIIVLEIAMERFSEEDEKATFMLGHLYVRMGYDSKALSNWSFGHTKGYFYGLNSGRFPNHFKDNMDFKPIAERDKYLGDSLDAITHLEYEVSLPVKYSNAYKYPVLFVFHGNGRNIMKAKRQWQSVGLSEKFIVVYVQSYIHMRRYDYKWIFEDEKTEVEFKQIYADINKTYSIDKQNIIFSSMSTGGIPAIAYGFNNVEPCSALLLICPVIPEIEPDMIMGFAKNNKKIVIITGENDFSLNTQKDLIEKFKEGNGKYKFNIIESMGHQFPDNFSLLIDEYTKWIID